MSAAVTGKRQCMGRKCGDKYKPGGEEHRFYRYKEDRCKAMCEEDETLCKACKGIQDKYMKGENSRKLWHGVLGENLPPESHIEGSAWNLESRVKENARFAKAAAKTAGAAATETVTAAAKVEKVAKTAGKEAKAAEKAAKEAEKAAAKAAADAEKAAKKAAKDALAEFKEHVAALGGAANVYAGLAPRKRRATTAKKGATAGRRRTAAARKRTSSSSRRSSSQNGNPFRMGAAVPPSPPMIYRPVSKASSASNSAYVPRNLSGDGGRIPSYRGASPNERSEETRAGIQDRILADMMEAQMARAM